MNGRLTVLLCVSALVVGFSHALPEPVFADSQAVSEATGFDAKEVAPIPESFKVEEQDSFEAPAVVPAHGKEPHDRAGSAPQSLRGYARKLKLTTGINGVKRSASKLQRTSLDMMGELERFNLFWGNPPEDYNPDMFWGGALTKEQVLEEFLRFPTTVFTTPSYVMRFSYRQPPRKKFLVYYARQLGTEINSIWRDLSETELPPGKQAVLAEPWTDLMLLFKDVQANYMRLYNELEVTPPGTLQGDMAENRNRLGRPLLEIYNGVYRLKAAAERVRQVAQE
ncbi:MAG TPA: hypothetical protein V6D08_06905 [Candidatus Obscuribacterales bacterium]